MSIHTCLYEKINIEIDVIDVDVRIQPLRRKK